MRQCAKCETIQARPILIGWGCSFPAPQVLFICETCEEINADNLQTAILKRCPEHFKPTLEDALDEFQVSDRETDFIDVLWNLGDTILNPDHEMAYLFKGATLPTPEQFREIMRDFVEAIDEKSPRCDDDKDPMAWAFCSQLFKEGER